MESSDKSFAGSIPEIYDNLLVPLIFQDYASDLAKQVAEIRPRNVLEIAAGTGAVTRRLAALLPKETQIVATDLNEPMLGRSQTRQGADRRIDWKQADALNLPFDDGSFDAVVCQFGAMFFPDKVKGYRQARRVLRPGGSFFFSVWDRIEDNEFAQIITETLAAIFPDDPPRFLARTPHGYHDSNRIRTELNEAGFSDILIAPVDHRSKALSPRDVAIGYCQGTPLRNEIESRNASGLKEATDHAERALATRFGDGAIDGRIRALVITAPR